MIIPDDMAEKFGVAKERAMQLIEQFNSLKLKTDKEIIHNSLFEALPDDERAYLIYALGVSDAMKTEAEYLFKISNTVKNLSDLNDKIFKQNNSIAWLYAISIILFLFLSGARVYQIRSFENEQKLKVFKDAKLPAYYQYMLKGEVE